MRKKENNCKCQICDLEFYRKPSLIKNNVYCSLECRDKDSYKYRFVEGLTEKEYLMVNYEVYDTGIIINKLTGKEVKFPLDHKGYMKTRLHTASATHKDGRKGYRLHRLIAMFYLDNYSNDLQVNHKNGIKTDNRVENLEMCTCGENMKHSWRELNRELKLNRGKDGKFITNK
jgi:hypothetical protein